MFVIAGFCLIIVGVIVAQCTELVYPSITCFVIGVAMMIGGMINDTLQSEVSELHYRNMLDHPYMIEYAKKHNFFDDGKISIEEYKSIRQTHLGPNKDKVLEMSRQ
jgi:hypothetical protein